MTFAEFGLAIKFVSDARMNFTSETFKEFCRKLNIQQSLVEACIKFLKHTIKKCTDTNQCVTLALLQTQSTSVALDLPSPAVMLFNRPIWDLLPQINRALFNIDNDEV